MTRSTHSKRTGFGMLATICMLAFAASLIAFSLHTLWRGSSRNLYALEEHRQLTNLSRSCLAEALYSMQIRLEQGSLQGNFSWIDWCTGGIKAEDHPVPLKWCVTYADQMCVDPNWIQYKIQDNQVTAHLVEPLSRAAGMSGDVGVIDLSVTATVQRYSPKHFAKVTLTQRHVFWFSNSPTPFSRAGRHIEILPTPAATFLRY